MYKFKKIFIFINGQKCEVTDLLKNLTFESYDAAHEYLKSQEVECYMFTLEEVTE